jgi:hypothetical protein
MRGEADYETNDESARRELEQDLSHVPGLGTWVVG